MNTASPVPHIERLDFFNGQRLFAEDLQTLDGFNRQMRWLHNLSLHTFGIGSGFAVRGEQGDREITISPGYAIDNQGREIILLLPQVETVPPVAGDGSGNAQFYDLTVHYPRTEDLEELETRAGICATHGVVRRREAPVFCWIKLFPPPNLKPEIDIHAEQIARGEKVVLARISVKNCQLETLSITTRRNVRPERLPYVACGRTPPGETAWEPWTVKVSGGCGGPRPFTIGAEVRVDTSKAKFASAPCYMARIVGQREFTKQDYYKPPFSENYILEGLVSIDPKATPNDFTLRVFLPRYSLHPSLELNPISGLDESDLLTVLTNAGWHVEWMGVEG